MPRDTIEERLFPIMVHYGHKAYIPWEWIAPHEAQAQRNHGAQTLERLAERGGLAPSEAAAVMEDRRWHKMDETDAWRTIFRVSRQHIAGVERERDGLASSLSEAATRAAKYVCRTCRMNSNDCDVHGEATNHTTCKRWKREARRLRAHEPSVYGAGGRCGRRWRSDGG